MDKNILKKLNLNDKEIKVFLALVKNGVQTVQQISIATAINRTTAYRVLDDLEQKGLIEWIIDERGRTAQAVKAENLTLLLSEQKKKVEELEKELPVFIKELSLTQPAAKLDTEVKYFKGERGIRQMIWNTLHTKETMRSYAALKRREFIDPKFEDKFEEEWAGRKLKDRIIVNENRSEYINKRMLPEYKKSLDIRIIPENKLYLTNDIAIYNDTLAIMSLEKGNLVGAEIKNTEITKTQKSLFDIVWEVIKPV